MGVDVPGLPDCEMFAEKNRYFRAAAAKAEAERVVAGEGTADPGVADQAITGSSGNLAAEMEARVNQQRGAPIVPNADGSPPSRGGR